MPIAGGMQLETDPDGAPRRRRRRDFDAEMDITPMIDVTFLMLIFFLVASTPDKQAAVELPPARYGVGVSQTNALIITVGDRGGETAPVFLADGMLADAELSSDLEARRNEIIDRVQQSVDAFKPQVLIKAARSVRHREVARVIRAVSQVEGVKIFLAVLDKD
jgi:biopolymer transport protein ExbD